MKPLDIQKVVKYVEDNIAAFHIKRIENINKLKLSQVLEKILIYSKLSICKPLSKLLEA